MEPLAPQFTLKYKTYLKRAVVEAVRGAFAFHPDPLLKNTKVTIEYPVTENEYPAVVIRFFERSIDNAGVGHVEWVQGETADQPDAWTRKMHVLYHGTLEYDVRALSSYDRDLIADSLVEIFTMSPVSDWANGFLTRIYDQDLESNPYSLYHFVNINTDKLQPFGEPAPQPAPWGAEDAFVYSTAYRTDAMGELYSTPPDENYGLVEQVDQYPYIEDIEPRPSGSPDPAPWLSEMDDVDLPD